MHKKILIFGATSAIAQEVAKIYASDHAHFFLVGRDAAHLMSISHDLTIRGALSVTYQACDLTLSEHHKELISQAALNLGSIDLALLAHGTLPNQTTAEQSLEYMLQEFNTNLLSHVSILSALAPFLEEQRHGCIAVISSVAGDRGRQSNYVYGAAKAGLSVFLQGLRNRLLKSHVNVLTIKPGFVDTPMTSAFKKGFLWSSPDVVATHIVQSIKKQQLIIYTPGFWRYIMFVIKLIPERIFCRLSL